VLRTAFELWRRRGATSEKADAEVAERGQPAWWIVAWLLALPVVLVVFGVIWGVGLYTIAFLLGFERRRPSVRQVIGALIGGFVISYGNYAIFVQQFGIRFHPGIMG
jgi:hypothetical protein